MSTHAYATVEDLDDLSVPAVVFRDVEHAKKLKALRVATSEMDSYIQTQHAVPLTIWPDSLRLHVSNMAAWHLLRMKGITPDSNTDEIVRLGYTDALKYGRDIAKGVVVLSVTETAPARSREPDVATEENRGWDGDWGKDDTRRSLV